MLHTRIFIFPMGCKSTFGNVVHAIGSNLHFNPLPLVRHKRVVQRLVTVGFGRRQPISETRRVGFVDLGERRIDSVAFGDFVLALLGTENDANGQNVEHFLKGDVLSLHFLPDTVRALDARFDFVLHAHLIQRATNGRRELLKRIVALELRLTQFLHDERVVVGVLILERKVFEFCFDTIQPQSVRQRRKNIERLPHNFVLPGRRHRIESTHVVKAVGDFDENHPNIVAHREENLLKRLRLHRSTVAEDATAHFCHPFHDVRHLFSEEIGDIFAGIVGILHHIVEQRRTNCGRSHPHFLAHHLCHGNGVKNIEFSASASHPAVGRLGKVERLGDHLRFFSVT